MAEGAGNRTFHSRSILKSPVMSSYCFWLLYRILTAPCALSTAA